MRIKNLIESRLLSRTIRILLTLVLITTLCGWIPAALSDSEASKQAISENQAASPSFLKILTWRLSRNWNKAICAEAQLIRNLENSPAKPPITTQLTVASDITWIGHSTTLVRHDNKVILTDPIFSAQASPVSWAGPERIFEAALSIEQLPEIDYILISHNHYDHLDLTSLKALNNRKQHHKKITFFVPHGVKGLLNKEGIDNVIELSWWQEHTDKEWTITSTPVKHHSGRGMFDHNKSQWAGWALRNGEFSFFFAGDTGYSTQFKKIGEKLGPFTVAAIPIGGYAPRKLMKGAHVTPEEALAIHTDIQSELSLAIHWGTFLGLTDEPFFEPQQRLNTATQTLEQQGKQANFKAISIGEHLTIVPKI